MNKSGIMSCIDQIPYDSVNIMRTLAEESIRALGREKWNEIVGGIEVPADDMPDERRVRAMRAFLRRYDERVAPEVSRHIFCRVKHGLKHRDFTWAREKFLQYNDIDAFCAAMRRETIDGFVQSARDGSHYHGQPVDAAVLQFVIDQPHLLYGARDGKPDRRRRDSMPNAAVPGGNRPAKEAVLRLPLPVCQSVHPPKGGRRLKNAVPLQPRPYEGVLGSGPGRRAFRGSRKLGPGRGAALPLHHRSAGRGHGPVCARLRSAARAARASCEIES